MRATPRFPEPSDAGPGDRRELASAATTAALPYAPALDGLRGACLLAVLLFHAGFTWMSGGFLGVSTFFTLSGFLITTLLEAERDATGWIALRRFWERRLRRLLPAAVLTIAAVTFSAPLWIGAAQRERLAEDALATLLYVVNWRFVSAEYAYGLIFSDPSPLQHFWSLAIEGQFYLLFPLVVAAVLRSGGGALALGIACALLAGASAALGFAVGIAPDDAQHRLYYGTDARAAELLIGALLALAWRHGVAPRGAWGNRALPGIGAVTALLVVAAWSRCAVDDAWLYRGGFAAYAVLSAIVIAAALCREGAVPALLRVGWLRWIGKVSYGAYLYHWPIFLWLDGGRTGWHPVPLFAARLALTLVLAGLSYRFVEEPIRRARALPGARFRWATAGALVGVALVAVATSPIAISTRLEPLTGSARAPVAGHGDGGTPTRFAMFGDSTAFSLWAGLAPWLQHAGGATTVKGYVKMGCGLFAFGERENRGRWAIDGKPCAETPLRWRESVVANRPDVAIVLIGPWEVRNRRAGPDAPPLALGDPELDRATEQAIADAVDMLAAAGATVLWLTAPHIRVPPQNGQLFDSDLASSDPARIDRLNELIRSVARSRPDEVRVVELAAYLHDRPGGEFDPKIRADDVHFSREGAAEVARDWLGPEILRTRRTRHALAAGAPARKR